MASSIRNLFLQVKQLMLRFTRQTYCYSVSGGFGQSCTGLEKGCSFTIMPLHTMKSVCANSWLRRWTLCFITLHTPPIWLLRTYSCFSAWRRPSKVHVYGRECHGRSCVSCSAIDYTGGLCLLFPESVRTFSNVWCSGWRLFWMKIKKICLYLSFCFLSNRIHQTF